VVIRCTDTPLIARACFDTHPVEITAGTVEFPSNSPGWNFDEYAGIDPAKVAKLKAKKAEKEAKAAKAAAKEAQKKAQQEELAKARAANEAKKAQQKAEKAAKAAAEAAEVKAWVDSAKATPVGSKKSVVGALPKGYCPEAVEAAWYEWWEASGFFKPDEDTSKEPFVMVIPPPNVTGTLHIGHALTNSIQDTVIRWRRMMGYRTLWLPGTDHAGIATQTVVEKKVARETGKTRHDLGREGFLKEVWSYVDDYGHRITNQLRRLGSSVDWSRQVFTMDEVRSNAVNEAFVRMHEKGLIYRDNRLVNWCCKLRTAVSDIEVDYIDLPKRTGVTVPGYDQPVEFGAITSFAYPYEDGSGEIVVATTRPETMLGDTAVAVHPDDDRYKDVVGKFLVHPINGRKIPVIADAELVDMEFGTGAVKITPAHDPNDFATGKRHNLEFINILDDNGCLNSNGTGQFAGQRRFDARVTVVDHLREIGLFRGVEDNPMRLGLCSRSKDVIEPVLKPQWWVACGDMAADGCELVRSKKLEIVPSDYESTWFRWMENIRDWCISRQLWWGHRIPAYYVSFEGQDNGSPGAPSEDMKNWVVARTREEAEQIASQMHPGRTYSLIQDEDVLDTWFSSGLFPFSVFGWPNSNSDLDSFFPGALLETGHDILFFWVARMVMMSRALTGEVPFKQVYLHAMVRDAHGRKMSKSLGNVIDPTNVIEGISLDKLHESLMGGNLDPAEVEKAKAGQKIDFPDGIEECGADALRFALVSYTAQGRDINLDIKRVVSYRHWCNKLWNAIRFAMMNLGDDFEAADFSIDSVPYSSKWILSRLSAATKTITSAMYAYDFYSATTAVYAFWQYELCDVFIELAKPLLYGTDEAAKALTKQVLYVCLESGLRLLHPFMPFVTEELWQRLPGQSRNLQQEGYPRSLMVSEFPKPNELWENPIVDDNVTYMMAIVNKTRSLRSDYGLTKEKPELYITATDPSKLAFLETVYLEIATLTSSSSVKAVSSPDQVPKGCGVAVLDDSTTVHVSLIGVLDVSKEISKLEKKHKETATRLDTLEKKMKADVYVQKTPDTIKQADEGKATKLRSELDSLEHHIADFKALL
jgi:valyl-tRNA synthetase